MVPQGQDDKNANEEMDFYQSKKYGYPIIEWIITQKSRGEGTRKAITFGN